MSTTQSPYKVRAVHCDYRASDDEVYEALKRATDPLTESWERLRRAKRIGIKFNQDKEPKNRVYFEGQLQQLVTKKVGRAVLRLLRERTDAELIAADVSFYTMYNGATVEETTTFADLFQEFDVTYVDGTRPPYKVVEVPGGGQMFRQYLLPEGAVEVDEFVSVAKMKNHAFMGVTLTLKNLFGLMPGEPEGHTRTYFHHLVRMPYMLADLGRIFNPVLNIIDATISQAGREWGNGREDGPTRITNALIAGNHTIATDACAAHLMGHDPQSDWLTEPFHRDRNSLLVAAEAGFGTVNLDEIDFQSEVQAPLGHFYAVLTDPVETVISWRRTTAEQALYYLDHQRELVDKYAGEYILLQDGEVRWHNTVSDLRVSRRILAGEKKEQAMWMKYVDPEEREGEHYEVYDHALRQARAAVA
ncbi:DUF362 domain-containing protein [Litorilinea aerophila]|uniref:DUF362 domain-containing protein n=1 Tax=Litorilinea aerophila TaxID=1204385 RepID=A0A540VL33_9CHLR|nr:DUF362 domain-containing protein [Litorilinea aerophila]MCC9075168.1 DUF362 domain-containing protein [Litorilinea aerophila]